GGWALSVPATFRSNPCLPGYESSPPRCHLPIDAVAYPFARNKPAIVVSVAGRNFVQSGTSSFGLSGIAPGIQSVMWRRAGYLPVSRAARVGEQTVQAE